MSTGERVVSSENEQKFLTWSHPRSQAGAALASLREMWKDTVAGAFGGKKDIAVAEQMRIKCDLLLQLVGPVRPAREQESQQPEHFSILV